MLDEVVPELRQYSENLLRNARRFVEIGDIHGAEIIQGSCVGCFAHLAALCNFIGWLEPNSKPQMDEICDWSLEQLGDLTQAMGFDEYTYFDLLLRVRRLVSRSRQEVVVTPLVWLDFMGKLVGCV